MTDELREVVYTTATKLVKLPHGDLAEGFYVVGMGSTGVASSLAVITGIYASTCVAPSAHLPSSDPPLDSSRRGTPHYIPRGRRFVRGYMNLTLIVDKYTGNQL